MVIRLSDKVDKTGSNSLAESNTNLLARVQTLVPNGAVFTDTVWTPFDVTAGSLELEMIAQLGARLGTFHRTIQAGDLGIPMVNNLQPSLTA